jgi:hypothetical protein
VIAQGQALHRGEHGHQVAVEAPALAAYQLGHVRVLLLGHDRRPGGEGVGQLDEAELGGGPQGEVGGQTAHVHAGDGRRGQELHEEVPIADGVETVRAHGREGEVAGQGLAVDGEPGAGQRAAAQRQHVGAGPAGPEALAVALEHEHVGQQMVAQHDRLGPLQVRVARHGRLHGAPRPVDQDGLGVAEPAVQPVHRIFQIEALVQRDLVVARAPRVELAAQGPDQLHQATLDIHVNVLELGPERKGPGLELAADRIQALEDGVALGVGEESRPAEGPGPGFAALEVVSGQPSVEGQGGGEALGGGVSPPREATGPGLLHVSSAAISTMIRWVTPARTSRGSTSGTGANTRGRPKRTRSGCRRGM